jgi:hypothetical protein
MNEPKLDKPGAGLPWPQKLFVPFLVRRISKKDTWDVCARRFERQSEKISKFVDLLDERSMQTQILVPRLKGLEDSSRYWSIAMTLEHLIIVTEGISEIIIKLSKNEPIDYKVDTAKVKPQNRLNAQRAKTDFDEMAKRVSNRMKSNIGDQNSSATHPHPWFGPFTAHQWYWLLSSHEAIHLEQMKHILRGLN